MSPLVNVTLPVYNEAEQLASSVRRVVAFLSGQAQYQWELVIADNGSTDGTREVAERVKEEGRMKNAETGELATGIPTRVERLEQAGLGRALKAAWLASEAEVLSYMDIDLSTDLVHLPELIGAVAEGRADVAVGSRLLPESRTTRAWKRELISRTYNRLLRVGLGLRVRDAQCGFKAISRRAAQARLPQVRDPGFFFDTELLVLAQRGGWRVLELPVRWVEDPDSRVRLWRTIGEDFKGIWRMQTRRED